MRTAEELMVQYAAYHRDRRNIATHFVGIPLIVFGVGVLLARAALGFGGWSGLPAMTVSLAWVAWLASTVWYFSRGNLVLALGVSMLNAVLMALAQPLASSSTSSWLAWGLGTFVLGWAIQFVGHHYEGRKPAFVDDIVGLLVGPMFVAGEVLFAIGLCKPLAERIEREVGPTVVRDLARPVG